MPNQHALLTINDGTIRAHGPFSEQHASEQLAQAAVLRNSRELAMSVHLVKIELHDPSVNLPLGEDRLGLGFPKSPKVVLHIDNDGTFHLSGPFGPVGAERVAGSLAWAGELGERSGFGQVLPLLPGQIAPSGVLSGARPVFTNGG